MNGCLLLGDLVHSNHFSGCDDSLSLVGVFDSLIS